MRFSPLVLQTVALVALGLVAVQGHGRAGALVKPREALEVRERSQAGSLSTLRSQSSLMCTISAFFSTQPENRMGLASRIDGRGLLSCRNDQGFQTEAPVQLDLEAAWPSDLQSGGEIAFSGNTSVFVVPREISQIQDHYTVREFERDAKPSSSVPAVLFKGRRHDVVIEMRLTSQTARLNDVRVKALGLRFDESAPDLNVASSP